MTNQEIFDKVVEHLHEQGKPSMQHGKCRYRGPDGTKCAIGILIPEEAYSEEMEGDAVFELVPRFPNLFHHSQIHILNELQLAHDNHGHAANWWAEVKHDLRRIALDYNFEIPEVLLVEDIE